jgi:photosynthetic reaction center cytochrome c subunit
MNYWVRFAAAFLVLVGVGLAFTFEWPSTESVQNGPRGIGMDQVYNRVRLASVSEANWLPDEIPPTEKAGQPSSAAYQNVQVLGDVDANEFIRIMTAITAWVSPEQGCTYCHKEGEELSADTLYTKRVARRMLQMTRHINADWKTHVAGTGVTCFTCHRGQPVPARIWFNEPDRGRTEGLVGNDAGQNKPAATPGLASLPYDPLTPFLERDNTIRVASTTALPDGNRSSIKQTEWTYALMIHMSESLGVNCTYCHNSRQFRDWGQSSPQRVTAWHGIHMVRDLNMAYLDPLKGEFPPVRLGPLGDAPKANCATCHQGAYKPLLGVSLLKDFPDLAGPSPGGAAPKP